MAYAQIKLYYGTETKKWKLTANKLFIIERIEDYLNAFDYIAFDNYQYVKNDIALTLKFDLSQRYTDPLIKDGIKYVRVLNSDSTTPVYYFVDNAEWRGKECVRLTLSMDILNTFKYGVDYKLSDKTKITRQHKNRLVRAIGHVNGFYRLVDKMAENINPNLYKFNEYKINGDGRKWYLIYKNQLDITETTNNPIECYLCADSDLIVTGSNTDGGNVIAEMLQANLYYYFVFNPSMPTTLYINGELWQQTGSTNRYQTRIVMRKTDNVISLTYQTWDILDTNATWQTIKIATCNYFTFENTLNAIGYRTSELYDPTRTSGTSGGTWYKSATTQNTLKSIEWLDRTNPQIIKVIELPYCPIDFDPTTKPSGWQVKGFMQPNNTTFVAYKLDDLNTKFNTNFIDNHTPLVELYTEIANLNPLNDRNDKMESKIFNSEFYAPKFVYDSFIYNFDLEKVDIPSFRAIPNGYTTARIKYNVSNTISGKFMFTFADYVTKEATTQDYSNILVIARNNEIALYNSAYINWLRNGYNYDIKQKNRAQETAIFGTIMSGLATLGAFASSVYTGGFGVAMGVSMATTTASQIYNLVNTINANEESLQQKQEQLKNQSASVSGCDDIDLLNVYTDGNKAKWVYYKVSEQMNNAILDLFYYCGYADNVQQIPVVNTRTWFNFIACDIVLDYTNNMSNAQIEQLKTMYANGVTFMHYYNGTWDIDQTHCNMETYL